MGAIGSSNDAGPNAVDIVVQRFQERQPFAGEEQWQRFALLMRKQLERSDSDRMSDILRTAIMTVDGMQQPRAARSLRRLGGGARLDRSLHG